ncbi:activator of 90 kDa heat shock protein ATPase homolog 1-like [Argiope bruennichi]|uniref:activator of 90 kDa heat shock protein ATPase homolog 1-like n=1 Tax=Argiope bruennichi TaxID=94029 RepID=UPI002494E282|nr:activator of 90 kDa heat shock protein ATPase homolog 1-like [Argiope bruennichi]
MAKWGKGDPRRLVEDRPDAKNVNNWHWSEKNASYWSKEKLKKIFIGAKIQDEIAQCVIVEMTKCEGDAIVNNRKSKLIVFYDWVIEFKWIGSLKYDDSDVEGYIEIHNFSEDHDINDIKIRVHSETNGAKGEVIRDAIQEACVEVIRKNLKEYVTSLKEEFANELILPVKDNVQKDMFKCKKSIEKIKLFDETGSKTAKSDIFETCEISNTETFKCTAQEFYLAMTLKELVQAFTQSNCILETEEGGRFELFDGNVQGYFTKLVPYRLIEQKWRFRTWPEGHFSNVSIDINERSDCTEINIHHKDIPKDFLEFTREGWKKFYWDSMKRILGFGSFLL